MKATGELARIVAFDEVLPTRVTRELRRQVIAAKMTGTYVWYPLDAPPRTLFEQVIQRLSLLVPGVRGCVGAEWWSRALPSDGKFDFHFDRDEAVRERIVSPYLASILYLSEAGGPTLIVDARPSSRAVPRVAAGVGPRPGRFAIFPGTLLHAVVPGKPGRWPRVTMLVNWWKSEPLAPKRVVPRGLRKVSPLGREGRGLYREPQAPREGPLVVKASSLMERGEWLAVMEQLRPGAER